MNHIPLCEICKTNECDYEGRLILDGTITTEKHYICHNCIAINLQEIYSHFRCRLGCYSLPISFLQTVERNSEDGIDFPHLIPIQRKGDMFEV